MIRLAALPSTTTTTTDPASTFLLLLNLQQQGTVDMRQDTTKGNGGADQRVEFFVATNGQLEMTRGDAFDFEIFGRVLSIIGCC